MPFFFAKTTFGLHEVLLNEIKQLDLKPVEVKSRGVYFESSWQGCYLANLALRTASRIELPILDFPAYNPNDLYHNIYKKHDFTKYIDPSQTLAIKASTEESILHDQRLVAMKIKDAIVDQFREKFGERPNVDTEDPDLLVVAHIFKNQVSISVDTSGDPLFKRGYRKRNVIAPLKESLAAGLLYLSEWDQKSPIIDPMCGSGTFLIEAALMALNIAPGTLRKKFSFQKHKGFQADSWQKALDQVSAQEKNEIDFKFYGFDKNPDSLAAAKMNAKAAGVDEFIIFKREAVDLVKPPIEKGMIVTNPPYGKRLSEIEKDLYLDLSFSLKQRFKGWPCWILSGNKELTQLLKMKSQRKYFVFNGPLECRFLNYQIY